MLGSVGVAEYVSTALGRLQEIRTVQSGLESAEHAVDLLAGLVGGGTSGKIAQHTPYAIGGERERTRCH